MNERFEHITEQVDEYFDDLTIEFSRQAWMEKFAELIVKECARVARATPCPYTDELMIQQLGHTWDMASSAAGREIVQHFIVEECWCESCKPNTMTDMRMILCQICGNKRCPHATNHNNECTNSNEPGQKGSSWENYKV